jgi:hypothetical protein
VPASLSLSSASAFRPAPNETLFYDTLVVGNTLAAYTATLAILQAGGQVCWVKAGAAEVALTGPNPLLPQVGNRVPKRFQLPHPCQWSRSQQQFWQQEGQQERLGPGLLAAQLGDTQVPSVTKTQKLRPDLDPYLSNQQLILIPAAIPVQVLYSQTQNSQAQNQRRVYQVGFQGAARRFQVHCGLTLDATAQGALSRLLEKATGKPLEATQVILTEADRYPTHRRPARGTCFDDTIGVVAAGTDGGPQGQKSRPMTVPLRSLIPKDTDGFLRVSQPGSAPALQALWQQPSVQWALGEAAGHIAALSAQAPDGFRSLVHQTHWRQRVQGQLARHGIPIFAFDDVDHHDPDFEAIQVLAAAGIVRSMSDRDLHFRPETPVTRAVVATALVRLAAPAPKASDLTLQDIFPTHWAWQAVTTAVTTGLMPVLEAQRFGPSKVLSRQQLVDLVQAQWPDAKLPPFPQPDLPARRRHLSRLLYPILKRG